jgi:hypothetical protein
VPLRCLRTKPSKSTSSGLRRLHDRLVIDRQVVPDVRVVVSCPYICFSGLSVVALCVRAGTEVIGADDMDQERRHQRREGPSKIITWINGDTVADPPFSTKALSQTLQSRPMRAPARNVDECPTAAAPDVVAFPQSMWMYEATVQ